MSQLHSSQVRLFSLVFVILALLLGSSWLLHNNFQNVSYQTQYVTDANEVINHLELTLSAVKDAETGVRGYLLAGSEEYLEPYRAGVVQSRDRSRRLKIMVAGKPGQEVAADQIIESIERRLGVLELLLESYKQNKTESGRRNAMFTEGKDVMDQLRLQIERMKDSERTALRQYTITAERSKDIFNWVLIATSFATTAVILFSFVQISRNQMKAIEENREKTAEAYEKEMLSQLAKSVAGDVTLEQASQRILKFLAEKTNILAGKIWALDREGLMLASSYGVEDSGDKRFLNENATLIRSTLDRKSLWQVSNVPENYWRVSSGLGSSQPTQLTLLPFTFQSRPLGVVELASFETLPQTTLHLLEKMAETIGIGVNAAQSRTHLQVLLEKTQLQSEELIAQQEELRTNNEELEQQSRALESQQQALNYKNKELEMSQAELEGKADDLRRSSQYKSEFLAKMSHELRTPLNGLLILSTLLVENKEKNLTEQQRQFAKSIKGAGNDLLALINDILDLSKIEARKLSLRPEDFTLGDLFASKRRTFEPQTLAKGLKLVTDLTEEMSAIKLHTDRQRLDQILRNFLSNAIKFTDKGVITLKATYNSEKQNIRITVQDSGIGIPADKREAIFEAFEQADSSVSRKYGGTGLGLTISRELAGLLGGRITLESEEGKGSEFSIEIPTTLNVENKPSDREEELKEIEPLKDINVAERMQAAKDNQRLNVEVAKSLQHLTTGKKTIFVVEDDDSFRASIVEAVKAYGFEAIEAADGEVALAILNEHSPDAILLDIKLPGISGLGILEMIKQMPHLRHIPVHMISALEYQHNALRMGALGYLTKPVTIEKVRSALSRIENMISKKVRRVLLIEDDERQNEAIANLIGGADIEVISAKTGKSAVEKLKANGFDCIILDLTLPDVSGFDLLSELRDLEISLPPVVIYTGKDLSDEEERYLRKFSDSIVIKGVRSPERLLDEVNLFLHRVESLLPEATREMLSNMRSQEKTFEGKTVLITDDDIRNIFALTSALEGKGLHVRVARDGIEALEMLDSHDDINLVLMDIMMPRMDGFEAMRNIRASSNPRIKNLPVVALTAKAMKEDHEKCMEAGASDYLPKPLNLENLMTVLKVWLAPKGFLN